jgi:ABC-2 type transport system permease protein
MTFLASLRKEFVELARTYRLLILALVLILFGLLSPLMAKVLPELMKIIPGAEAFAGLIPTPTVVDAVTQFVKNMSQFGLLLALLLSMGAVAQEKDRGTAVLVLVKPLPRAVFILTKFVALALAFLACLLVASALGYLYTVILFQAPDAGGWLVMTLLMWMYLLVFVAVTLLGSTLVKSQAAAAGIGFAALLLMGLVGAIPGLGKYLPSYLTSWGGVAAGLPAVGAVPSVWPALAVSVAIIIVSLLAAWAIFERQEL